MAVEWLRFSLRGYGGEKPTGVQFFELVGLEPESVFAAHSSTSPYQAARIVLLEVTIAECQPGTERYEEFATRIHTGLLRAAEWLASRSPTAFDTWRESGRVADISISGWMNSDQFDLKLPHKFLLACGKLGLPIEICTND